MLLRTALSTLFPYTTLFRSIFERRNVFDGDGPRVAKLSHTGEKLFKILVRRGAHPRRTKGDDAIKAQKPFTRRPRVPRPQDRSEEHTSELQSHHDLVCRLLL